MKSLHGGRPWLKFHNTRAGVYAVRMTPSAPRTMLARLRSSARLAGLMLLVFALKIGAVAACAQHDFADMGLGAGGDPVVAVSVADGSDPSKALVNHAGACTHCSSHHAAALMPTSTTFAVIAKRGLNATSSGLPPSGSLSLDLRPPIA